HDITHHGRITPGPHRADEYLARVHADAHLHEDPEARRERGERLVHPQCRADGPFRVVLVRDRRAEERHDLVTDDLVEATTEVDDVADERLEAGVDQTLDLPRVTG